MRKERDKIEWLTMISMLTDFISDNYTMEQIEEGYISIDDLIQDLFTEYGN